MELFVIRHGETYGNLDGNGFTETDLTSHGEAQAALLGERFQKEEITRIYVSPLLRAVRTAKEITKRHPEVPVTVLYELMERGTAPDYEGLPQEKLREHIPALLFDRKRALGEETPEESLLRAEAVIGRIRQETGMDGSALIVAHGTFNTYLLLAALGLGLLPDFNFSQENTGVTRISFLPKENGGVHTKLRYMNDISHLAPLGEPYYRVTT